MKTKANATPSIVTGKMESPAYLAPAWTREMPTPAIPAPALQGKALAQNNIATMGTQGAVQDYLKRSSDAKFAAAKGQAASSPMSPIPGKPSKPSWQNMANMQKQNRPVAPPPATDGAPANPAVPNVPDMSAPRVFVFDQTFDETIDGFAKEQERYDNRANSQEYQKKVSRGWSDEAIMPARERAKTKKEAAQKMVNSLMGGGSETGFDSKSGKPTFPERGFYSPYADTPTRPGIPLSSPMDKTGRPIVKR
jgi:hypothetical protein